MRANILLVGCSAAFLCTVMVRPMPAQEVYHPGETYNSLQAGQDAYWDAEAERRALIGRQLMIEAQIMAQDTWADPQDRYRPVRPESYGPILPQVYAGPTLANVYAYPANRSGPVFYGGAAATGPSSGYSASSLPVFEPWPRVPNDIWAAPYYGYVRQPIGHIKIWTSRLGYIYKPVYASPPMEGTLPAAGVSPQARGPGFRPRPGGSVSPPAPRSSPPPPPSPAIPPSGQGSGSGGGGNASPPKSGQAI